MKKLGIFSVTNLYLVLLLFLFLFIIHVVDRSYNDVLKNRGLHKAVISKITEDICPDQIYNGVCYTLEAVLDGDNEIIEITQTIPKEIDEKPSIGERILVTVSELDQQRSFHYNGHDRTSSLLLATITFMGIVIIITRSVGIRALFSLLVSVVIVGALIIPAITDGYDPYLVTVFGGFGLLSILMVISHGANRTVLSAILGSGIALLVAFIVAVLLSNLLNINGIGSDEASMLALGSGSLLSIRDIVIGSFVLGAIAVLDDAAISQALIVSELSKSERSKSYRKVFDSAMRIGVGHIGSLINTLFLAYVASSLPLVVLIFNTGTDLFTIINSDLMAEEFTRIVSGSVSLVISIPITTVIAIWIGSPKGSHPNYPHHH